VSRGARDGNPLARYAMIANGEQIHPVMYPGSIFGRNPPRNAS